MGGNRIAALRRVVAAGVSTLKGETIAPEAMQELRELTVRMEAITRRTPITNLFVTNPEAMDLAGMAPYVILGSISSLLVTAPELGFIVRTVRVNE
jgi:hypothetical protein